MINFTMRKLFTAILFMSLILPGLTFGAAFTPGNIVVYRIGDGVGVLAGTTSASFLDEYTPAGVLVQSIAFPTSVAGSNLACTNSGTSTSEGFISLSGDGRYIFVAGYNVAPGGVLASASVERVAGRVDFFGSVSTSTYITDGSTGNARSIFSTNGTDIWMATSGVGVRYFTYGNTTTSTLISAAPTNTRVVNVLNGQLYITAGSGAFQGVASIGTGAPTTAGQTTTILPGFPVASGPSPYGYSMNATGDVIYLGDDRAIASGGGVQKWTLSGGTWTLAYTLNTGLTNGCRGVIVDWSGANPVIYSTEGNGTTNNSIVSVTDAGAASSFTVLASAGTNKVLRGIAFAPNSVTVTTATSLPAGTYNNITVNGGDATLSGNASVTGTLTLTSGNIITGANTLTLGSSGTNLGTLNRTSGTVIGTMARWFTNSTVSNVVFPVGTATNYRPFTISYTGAPVAAGTVTIGHIDGVDGTDIASPITDGGFTINRASNMYWSIAFNGAFGGTFDFSIDGNGQNGINDPTNLRGIYSSNGTVFLALGTHAAGSGTVANRTGVSGGTPGRFYIGGNNSNNPLPVELDNFVATTIKNEVILDFATGHEQNNSGFEIERATLSPTQNRTDADINFKAVTFIASKGNSNNVQGYKYIDGNLATGRYAYRLKQIDYNGNHIYFLLNNEVVISNPNKFSISQNYPNPFNPSTTIAYDMPFDGNMKLVIFDNLGREVKTLVNGNVNAGYYKVDFNASALPSGIYFYRVNAESGTDKFEKVFKMMLVK